MGLKLQSEIEYIFREGESVVEELVLCAELKECSAIMRVRKAKNVQLVIVRSKPILDVDLAG